MPMNVCDDSLNREKRNCPSNLVAVGIDVGEGSGVMVGSMIGGAAIVGATCGAQAVTTTIATTLNR
jgi:hypothetical protein